MKRVPLISALTVIVVAAVALTEWGKKAPVAAAQQEYESYAHRDGKKEAESDIAQCAPKWKVLGRVSNFEERKAILKTELGVELDWFAGCIVTEAIDKYRSDYNTTTRAYLVTRFGEDAVREVLGEPPKTFSERDAGK